MLRILFVQKFILFLLIGLFWACQSSSVSLPILGPPEHRIQAFRFMNQDSLWVDNQTFKEKIYVADFFFTTCPAICPIMKNQMLRVYEKYDSEERVSLLSHTIDPIYDTLPLLRDFASKLGVETQKWHFVTGDMDSIYHIAKHSYFAWAEADDQAPGGYLHSGHFILVDNKRQIRGVYDGTVPASVDSLLVDIDLLLEEI
ncbi:MAG: SCO family protein [Cytophagales bacterium]|nr:SCO family protein [Cytophagales bacterium]